MTRFILSVSLLLFYISALSQETKLYNPEADAKKEIKNAVKLAAKSDRHVFIQIGGNWCPWCLKFNKFVQDDPGLKSFLDSCYVSLHVNYDKVNKNEEVLASLGFPQRFGFPVFIILDGKGKRIHTQNSAYLELDKGYDRKKVLEFFRHWAPSALKPESYKTK